MHHRQCDQIWQNLTTVVKFKSLWPKTFERHLVFGGILNGLANFYAFGQIFKWPKLNKPSVRRVTLIIIKKECIAYCEGQCDGCWRFLIEMRCCLDLPTYLHTYTGSTNNFVSQFDIPWHDFWKMKFFLGTTFSAENRLLNDECNRSCSMLNYYNSFACYMNVN